MEDFTVYQQAVRAWLVQDMACDPMGFAFYGDGFDTFGVMWNDPSAAVTLDEAQIGTWYDSLIEAEVIPPQTLEERVAELGVETSLMQDILAYLMGVN